MGRRKVSAFGSEIENWDNLNFQRKRDISRLKMESVIHEFSFVLEVYHNDKGPNKKAIYPRERFFFFLNFDLRFKIESHSIIYNQLIPLFFNHEANHLSWGCFLTILIQKLV